MIEREPSRTAFAAAAYRAAHQVLDHGRIFADPLALSILGAAEDSIRQHADDGPRSRGMRVFIAARARFAEAFLKTGIETRGVAQLVVLGAGLDTFAYRNPFAVRLKVFEVDHPATQLWKQRRLNDAGIAVPTDLAYVPVDFERDSLIDRLTESGFDPSQRTFFLWLGVVPYLTAEAIASTLRVTGSLPGGAEIAFDYSDPPHTLSPEMAAAHAERAARVAAIGEPFLSYFEPPVLHALLREHGFEVVEDLGPRALIERLTSLAPNAQRAATAEQRPEQGGHLMLAMTPKRNA